MRHLISIPVLLVLAAPAAAGGYLPEHCAKLEHPPPEFFECPSPYVEMARSGKDKIFSRAWHCRETEHSLGLNAYGGCAGSKGLAMFPGWSVPEKTAAMAGQPDNLIAEIDSHVINPCLRVGIKTNEVFSQMNADDALKLMRAASARNIETVRNAMTPLARGRSLAKRMELYTSARAGCIAKLGGKATPAAASSVVIEPDAILGPTITKFKNRKAVLDDLVRRIRAKGWRCDSISAAHTFVFSRGFKVRCNQFAYQYAIKDRGGHWVVSLD